MCLIVSGLCFEGIRLLVFEFYLCFEVEVLESGWVCPGGWLRCDVFDVRCILYYILYIYYYILYYTLLYYYHILYYTLPSIPFPSIFLPFLSPFLPFFLLPFPNLPHLFIPSSSPLPFPFFLSYSSVPLLFFLSSPLPIYLPLLLLPSSFPIFPSQYSFYTCRYFHILTYILS